MLSHWLLTEEMAHTSVGAVGVGVKLIPSLDITAKVY